MRRERRREFLLSFGTVLSVGLAGCSEETVQSEGNTPEATATPSGVTPTPRNSGGGGESETPTQSDLQSTPGEQEQTPTAAEPESTPTEQEQTPTPSEPQSTPSEQEPTPTPTAEESYRVPFARTGIEAELRRQIDEFRTANGESELRYDELFREATRQHSSAMATAGEASLRIDGRTAAERVGDKTNCYADSTVARVEQPESRSAAVERIVSSWTSDDQSRTKILKSFHDQIGVGVVITEGGVVYVTASYC